MEFISSRTNPTVRLVRSLLTRRTARYRERAFVAEGLRAVATLIENEVPIRALLVDADRQDETLEPLLQAAKRRGARALSLDSALFHDISDVETPQAVMAIFEMPAASLPSDSGFVLALDGVGDPGNLGSILRTAQAAGVDGVVLLRGTVDPYNPKVVRATAGVIGRLPLWIQPKFAILCQYLDESGLQIVAAAGSGDLLYTAFDWTQPVALVVGGETSGVSREMRENAVATVRIPMAAGVESINVAAAAAVLLFEAVRRRLEA